MERTFRAWLLGIILSAGLCAPASAKSGGGLYVLVTASKGKPTLRCQVASEASPDGVWRWRVTVDGGRAPYRWRLPLYQVQHGENGFAAAQIGTALLDENRSFLIEVASEEVQRSRQQTLNLELSTEQGLKAQCPAPVVRASAMVEFDSQALQGSLAE